METADYHSKHDLVRGSMSLCIAMAATLDTRPDKSVYTQNTSKWLRECRTIICRIQKKNYANCFLHEL